jgi:hypothetical protein
VFVAHEPVTEPEGDPAGAVVVVAGGLVGAVATGTAGGGGAGRQADRVAPEATRITSSVRERPAVDMEA